MRVFVITPYCREEPAMLRANRASVAGQTHAVEHIMVADGYPVDIPGCIHIAIPPSRDVGTTPRNVGCLVAMAQGAEAIAFLDADCTFEPDHIANMVEVMNARDASVVTVPRNLYGIDDEFLGVDQESDGRAFNDTNCYLIRRDAFKLLDAWIFADKREALHHDRHFWQRVLGSGLAVARSARPTVNYQTTFAAHYLAAGMPVPASAKVIVKGRTGWQTVAYHDIQAVRGKSA